FGGRDGALGLRARKSQRFFAPDRFTCRRDRGNLPNMQGMRGGEKNSLDAGIRHCRRKLGGQFKAFGGGKIANELGLLADAAEDAQALAFALDRLDDIFSPSAKADYSSIDHGRRTEACVDGVSVGKIIGDAY